MKEIFGKSWQKVTKTINDASQKIYEEGSKRGVNFSEPSFDNYLDNQLEGLKVYVEKTSIADYQNFKADLLKQNQNDDWTKDALSLSTGAILGTLAGIGTSTVASSVFVQASLWTSIRSIKNQWFQD